MKKKVKCLLLFSLFNLCSGASKNFDNLLVKIQTPSYNYAQRSQFLYNVKLFVNFYELLLKQLYELIVVGLILVVLIKPGVGHTPVETDDDDDDETFSTVNALLDLIR